MTTQKTSAKNTHITARVSTSVVIVNGRQSDAIARRMARRSIELAQDEVRREDFAQAISVDRPFSLFK